MAKVLVAVLNWGLGHATRSVPLIQDQLNQGNEVIICARGAASCFLQFSFPALKVVEGAYHTPIHYYSYLPASWSIALQSRGFAHHIKHEYLWTQRFVEENQVDHIISDNCYGVFSDQIPSYLVTHQTTPIVPRWIQKKMHNQIASWCNRFTEVWIPDYAEEHKSLSGKLSDVSLLERVKHIGPLSRFSSVEANPSMRFNTVLLVSGPESLRTTWENQLIHEYRHTASCVLIAGQPHLDRQEKIQGIQVYSHLPDEELKGLLQKSSKVVCRSGYSSIMDMVKLGITNVQWVPTKGQSEQVYLAQRWNELFQ